MTKELEEFIKFNYRINERFSTCDIYDYFTNRGWSQSQISCALNNLKKKNVLDNEDVPGIIGGYDPRKGKRHYKQWIRLC